MITVHKMRIVATSIKLEDVCAKGGKCKHLEHQGGPLSAIYTCAKHFPWRKGPDTVGDIYDECKEKEVEGDESN